MITDSVKKSIRKKYEESKKIIMKAQDEQQLVLFVGAGISRDSGIPTWREAIDKIAKRLELEENEINDMLRIPQYYYNARGEKEYKQFMREIFKAGKDLNINSIHKQLMKINVNTIVTTNYDHLLEKAAEDNAEIIDVVSCNEDLPYRRGVKELIKIHGDFEHDNFVLKEDDYLSYSENFKLIENYIKSIIGTKVVLFVGYSFNDPDVKQVFEWVKEILKGDFQRAYLIDTGNEYDLNIEDYYKHFGINVLYSSVLFDDWEKNSHSKQLEKTLKWLAEKEELLGLDYIYDSLKPFSFMNYAYGEYIVDVFAKIGLYYENGGISSFVHFFSGTSQASRDLLNCIAYEASKRGEKRCYIYNGNNKKYYIELSEKYESDDKKKINEIIDILEKSSINRLILYMPINDEFPFQKGEMDYWGAHKVFVEITSSYDIPDWVEAVCNFDYKKLEEIEKFNDERLNGESVELYMEQAYIAYFRRKYLKAYNLLQICTSMYYKKQNYVMYFMAEICRKHIGEYIYLNHSIVEVNQEESNKIENEVKSIDLERMFRSLPDMGGENRILKDLYTCNFSYALFQKSYIQSKKVREQAETKYSFFAGTPAYYTLKDSIFDFYKFEVLNLLSMDEEKVNCNIYKLYFTSMILSVASRDKENDNDDKAGMIYENIYVKELSSFDILVGLKYMSVKELKTVLKNIKCNVSFSVDTQEYIVSIIKNAKYEPVIWRSDSLVWKLVCILGYSQLSGEMVESLFKVINDYTNGLERGEKAEIINKFLINVEKQKLYDKNNIKYLENLVNGEMKFISENPRMIGLYKNTILYGLALCDKYNKAYDKISIFKKAFKDNTEMVWLECYVYFSERIKNYIEDYYDKWKFDNNITDMKKYCLLVENKLLMSNKAIEKRIYEYCIKNSDEKEEIVYTGESSVEFLKGHLLEMFLHGYILDVNAYIKFVSDCGNDYQRWLIDLKGFDYQFFNVEWLIKCREKLLSKLAGDDEIKQKIKRRIIEEYNKNQLDDMIIKIFFEYFAN